MENSVEIVFERPGERWVSVEETRRGFPGYRTLRYTLDQSTGDFIWDEHYMFFLSLDIAFKAFKHSDQEGMLDLARSFF